MRHASRLRTFARCIKYRVADAAHDCVDLAARRMGRAELYRAKLRLRAADASELKRFRSAAPSAEYSMATPTTVSVIIAAADADMASVLQTILSFRRDTKATEFIVFGKDLDPEFLDELQSRVEGTTAMRADAGQSAARLRNRAAEQASGEYLLFAAAGVRLMGGALANAILAARQVRHVAAVGGTVILANGRVSSAGLIVRPDGSVLPYGIDFKPEAAELHFRRFVTALPAEFLLTRRDAFLSVAGFEEASIDDSATVADYCIRLQRSGALIAYCPEVSVSTLNADPPRLEHAARSWLLARHAEWLQQRTTAGGDLVGRYTLAVPRKRILFVDNRVPHRDLGHGLSRASRIIETLVGLNYFVTVYPVFDAGESWREAYRDIAPDVEIMLGSGMGGLRRFIRQRRDYYDAIIVSRLHNLRTVRSMLEVCDSGRRPLLMYDCESIVALREATRRRQAGVSISSDEEASAIADEAALARECDGVIAVSDRERDYFQRHGCQNVAVLGHSLEVVPSKTAFEKRRDYLFVGTLESRDSPNVEGLQWFTADILSRINNDRQAAPLAIRVVGSTSDGIRESLQGLGVELIGSVADLRPYYESARVSVAPIRIGAGIMLKVLDAAAHGVPVVTTALVAELLGWQHEAECLVADGSADFAVQCVRIYDDERLWNQLRMNALERVRRDYAPELFVARLRALIDGAARSRIE
jgi:glycosyltransferase involved in cell wall biosynthesis